MLYMCIYLFPDGFIGAVVRNRLALKPKLKALEEAQGELYLALFFSLRVCMYVCIYEYME